MSGKLKMPISVADTTIADLNKIKEKYKNDFKLVQSYIKNNPHLQDDPDTRGRRYGDFLFSFCDALAEKFLAVAVGQQNSSNEQQQQVLQQAVEIVKTSVKAIYGSDDAVVNAGEGRFIDCLIYRLSGEKGKLVKTVAKVLCGYEAMKTMVKGYLPDVDAMQDGGVFEIDDNAKRNHKIVLKQCKHMLEMMVRGSSAKSVVRDNKHSAEAAAQESESTPADDKSSIVDTADRTSGPGMFSSRIKRVVEKKSTKQQIYAKHFDSLFEEFQLDLARLGKLALREEEGLIEQGFVSRLSESAVCYFCYQMAGTCINLVFPEGADSYSQQSEILTMALAKLNAIDELTGIPAVGFFANFYPNNLSGKANEVVREALEALSKNENAHEVIKKNFDLTAIKDNGKFNREHFLDSQIVYSMELYKELCDMRARCDEFDQRSSPSSSLSASK